MTYFFKLRKFLQLSITYCGHDITHMITPPRLIDIKHPCSCTLESTIGIILYTQKASILNYFCTSRSSVIIIPPSPDVIFLIPSILIHTTSPKILLTDLYNKCQMHVMHLLLLVDYAFCKFIYSIKITTLSSIMYRHYSLRFGVSLRSASSKSIVSVSSSTSHATGIPPVALIA